MTTMTVNGKRVRCGNRKAHGGQAGYHTSTAEVRECYAGRLINTTNGRGERESYPIQPGSRQDALGRLRSSVPATDAQRGYIADLRQRKGLEPQPFVGSKAEASAEIERLLKIHGVSRPGNPSDEHMPTVPDGRYALDIDGDVKFYRVVTREWKRTGRKTQFVDVQASDMWHGLRVYATRFKVLTAIARDPKAASVRYGKLLGSCGICGRTLTDADSRARGIGPICADKIGW